MWAILIVGGVGLTALVVLGSMKTKNSASTSANLSTFTARRDDLIITVTESGSINARNTIDITCDVEAGRMGGGSGVTILSIVPEGTYITPEDVNNGKLLVELDSSVMEEQIEQYKIDVATAKASLTEANEANLIQVKQNESDITAAELAVKFARMDFQKYLGEDLAEEVMQKLNKDPNSGIDVALLLRDNPNDPGDQGGEASQMLKKYEDDILLARGQWQKYTDVLEGTQKLYDANYASALDLQSAKLDVQRFDVQTESAAEALRLYKLYDFPKEAERFLSDYEEAKRELDRTKARARSTLAQTEARLLSAQSRYDLQFQRLTKSEGQIAACLIKAPAPGLVVYASSSDVFSRRGGSSRNIAEGETVYERQKIISLPDTAAMIVEIAVHEAEVDKVRPGQRAVITLDPFPDKTFKGVVLKVAQLPDSQRGFLNPDLKVYSTQVLIEGTHDFLKPGMSAKVEILVERLDDVIIVPVQVVANRGGKKVCFVLTAEGKQEEREIQTGAFDDTFVQIVEGLEEGENVLLNPKRVVSRGGRYESKQETDRFESDEPGSSEPNPAGPPAGGDRGAGRRGQGSRGTGGEGRQRREGSPGGAPGGPRASQGGGGSGGNRPSGGGMPELTEERIDGIMSMLAQRDPAKAKELEPLRKSEPEKFKAELIKAMQSMFGGAGRSGNQGGRGGNAGPGRG
jgi:multidrug resistance efflux pump